MFIGAISVIIVVFIVHLFFLSMHLHDFVDQNY